MTGNAAGLEDVTRWLGIVIAVIGAWAVNPEATAHGWRTFYAWLIWAPHQFRGFLARFIPSLRQDATVTAVAATAWSSASISDKAYARGVTGWGPRATSASKFAILDKRTLALDAELGDLQIKVDAVEQRLRNELTDAIALLRGEAVEIRAAVEEVKQETVQLDASALPLIVLGVVLAGLAPDAEHVPLWLWSLGLAGAIAVTVWRTVVIFRKWRVAVRLSASA